MSLAEILKKRAEEVLAMRRDHEAQEKQQREDAATEFQSRIFERARGVYDKCLCAVREAVERRADLGVSVKLDSERFDKGEFTLHLICWQMAVLALQENCFEARFEFSESKEPDEMRGGTTTVYTPYIYVEWHTPTT